MSNIVNDLINRINTKREELIAKEIFTRFNTLEEIIGKVHRVHVNKDITLYYYLDSFWFGIKESVSFKNLDFSLTVFYDLKEVK